jgi:hypothetical protein
MSLTKRLERLEAHIRAQNREGEFWVCRQLIYDPREWACGQEEAIAQVQTEELDRLVASGEIKETDRERANFIVNVIVYPPERRDDPLSSGKEAA